MTAAHRLLHRGHLLEIEPATEGAATTTVLRIDGREIATTRTARGDPAYHLDELDAGLDLAGLGLRGARITMASWRTGRVFGVALVLPSRLQVEEEYGEGSGAGLGLKPERIPFAPPLGTRAHRRYELSREHPRAYAARHVVKAVLQVGVALLLARVVFSLDLWGWLPRWDPDLPPIPWPDLPRLPWPDWSLPDWSLPGWVHAVLDSKKYWLPLLVGVGVALGEIERRRKRQVQEDEHRRATEDTEGGASRCPAPSTPSATRPDDSSSSTRP